MNPHPGILCPGSSPPWKKTGQQTAASAATVQWGCERTGGNLAFRKLWERGSAQPREEKAVRVSTVSHHLEDAAQEQALLKKLQRGDLHKLQNETLWLCARKERLPSDSGNALKHSVQNRAEFPPLGVCKLQLKSPAQPDWVTFCSEQECDVGVASKGPTPATLLWVTLFCRISLLMQYRNTDPTHSN